MHQQTFYFAKVDERGEVVCQAAPRGMTLEHVSAMVRDGNPAQVDVQVGVRTVLETVLEPGRLATVGRQGFEGGQFPHVGKGELMRVRVASLSAQADQEGEKKKRPVSEGVSIVITLVEG